MKIVYLGSGEFGIECLRVLAGSNNTLDFIVTQPPRQAGRGRKPKPTPVADWAKNHSIPFIETDNVNTPETIEEIRTYRPELIVVIAFGQKIGNELIALPAKGSINVHASLLPRYRGAAPINRVIINGETQTGITIITLAEKMDAGKILAQQKIDIETNETAGQLHDRLAQMAAPLLLGTIEKIADGSVIYTEQDHSKATLAPKIKKSDGFLDFSEPAENLVRKILGFWPWPGASAIYVSKKSGRCERLTIGMAEIVETSNPDSLQPGILDNDLNITCGKNALKVTQVKPAGGSLMAFADFVNGRSTQAGDLFMKIDK